MNRPPLLNRDIYDGYYPPRPSSIENDAHGIKKLLLKIQVSLTSFLQSEVNQIIHTTLKVS